MAALAVSAAGGEPGVVENVVQHVIGQWVTGVVSRGKSGAHGVEKFHNGLPYIFAIILYGLNQRGKRRFSF